MKRKGGKRMNKMRIPLCLCLMLILFFFAVGAGKGRILIDSSHENRQIDRLEKFKSYFSKEYEVKVAPISEEDLYTYDLVIITNPFSEFTQSEITKLTEYVEGGGTLLLTSWSDYNDTGSPQFLNPLLEAMGSTIRFNDDQVVDDENNQDGNFYIPVISDFVEHPITLYLERLNFYSTCSLVVGEGAQVLAYAPETSRNGDYDENGDAIIYEDKIPMMAVQKIGEGHVVTMGTNEALTDYEDAFDSEIYSNLQFCTNLVNFATGQPSTEVKKTQKEPQEYEEVDFEKSDLDVEVIVPYGDFHGAEYMGDTLPTDREVVGKFSVQNNSQSLISDVSIRIILPQNLTLKKIPKGSGEIEGNSALFKLSQLSLGEKETFSLSLKTPFKVTEKTPAEFRVVLKYTVDEKALKTTAIHTSYIVPAPIWKVYVVGMINLILISIIVYAGAKGKFKFYKNIDLIYMGIFGSFMVVWVWIGYQFIFPVADRIPFSYNFAVADAPYIWMIVAVAMIVRKPGAVTGTLVIYNLGMDIIRYGFNPYWFMYPIIQGLPVDLYLFLRGKNAFLGRMKFLDGFMVGGIRGLAMQGVLFFIFRPALQHEFIAIEAAIFMTLTWAIGNAVAGAIGVPIAEKIREAVI